MSDATPGAGPDASGTPPVADSPEIARLRKELDAQWERRFKGMQKVVSEKDSRISDLSSKLEELETAGLPPEEQVAVRERKLREENKQLKAQLELDKLAVDYPDVIEVYRGLLEGQTAKDQLELLKSKFSPQAPADDKSLEAEGVIVPDVDANNPIRRLDTGVRLPDGTLMTDAVADQIMGLVGRQADVTQKGPATTVRMGAE